jgi:hypothetical protein
MLTALMLNTRFAESYGQIKQAITPITHTESLRTSLPGINPTHWLVGHVVVARANFLTLLAVPSIWPWEISKRFIPGSIPTAEDAEAISFETLRLDLDHTQELLAAALAQTSPDDLAALRDKRPIGDHLLEYATHEAYHAGQLTILTQVLLTNNDSDRYDEER